MEPSVETGRRWIIAIIAFTLITDMILFLFIMDWQSICSLFLYVGLFIFIYRGERWARILSGALLTLRGLGGLFEISKYPLMGSPLKIVFIILAIAYLLSAYMLFNDSSVLAYCKVKKAKPIRQANPPGSTASNRLD